MGNLVLQVIMAFYVLYKLIIWIGVMLLVGLAIGAAGTLLLIAWYFIAKAWRS